MTQQARLLGGRYQLGELLGYGGMAEVHLGRDLRLGRDVAIKMLRADLARDATFQARFRREAQNAASLNHPAIVAVYDTGEEREDGVSLPYIVMEYVNGRTLKEVLAAEGRIMPRRALEIVADTSAALEFSHRHQIIHRDIKPGNVMLTRGGQVKVMDFGIARALASGTSTMTATSAVIGTAQYLSPEQARGEAVDARSDVYATGCVLYELVCGQPPFSGDNPVSVAYQHVREDPRPPSELNPDISPDIDAVVLKALAKNPINRYQSAGEMRADLLRAAAGRPVQATPVLPPDERTHYLGPVAQQAYPTLPVARVPDEGKRRAANWALLGLGLLAVFALVAAVTGWILLSQTDKVAVPDVTNQKFDAAVLALKANNLKYTRTDEQNSNCTKGNVMAQSPAAGNRVEKGATVALTVCAGPATVKIPDVEGETEEDAREALEKLNLVVKVENRDGRRAAGTVQDTHPKPGKEVKVESTVTLYVSRGNKTVLPDVVGDTRDEAVSRLENAGFNVNVEERPAEAGETPNTVVDQSPNGGALVFKNSNVTITVVTEPVASPSPTPTIPPTPTPTLTGDTVGYRSGDARRDAGTALFHLGHEFGGQLQGFGVITDRQPVRE